MKQDQKYSAMHKDLKNLVTDYLIPDSISLTYDEALNIQETIDNATTEQLWSVYKLILRKEKFKVLPCDVKDHLAVQYAGCYCGIEPDGYMHS